MLVGSDAQLSLFAVCCITPQTLPTLVSQKLSLITQSASPYADHHNLSTLLHALGPIIAMKELF